MKLLEFLAASLGGGQAAMEPLADCSKCINNGAHLADGNGAMRLEDARAAMDAPGGYDWPSLIPVCAWLRLKRNRLAVKSGHERGANQKRHWSALSTSAGRSS